MDNLDAYIKICNQNEIGNTRTLDPNDIYVPSGYRVEVFAEGLDLPICLLFLENGDLLLAESGYITGNPRVLRLRDGAFEVIAEGFNIPITGLGYYDGNIYVSNRGKITVIRPDGSKHDVISGLSSIGDYYNSNIDFGPDGKMYFGQGTATNSGVVGPDNIWVIENPYTYDYPGSYIMVKGQNFESNNLMASAPETVATGAFSPFGVPNMPFEVKKGIEKASGSILKANRDGTELEMVAWGFRNPAHLKFDEDGRLYVANQGYNIRGSRPIANAPDTFELVIPGVWYGWPDFAGGEPVTSPRFMPEGRKQPEFLLVNHPNVPPVPFAIFPSSSNIMGFDFCYNTSFGQYGDVYIAEFGVATTITFISEPSYSGVGHRISRINMNTGGVTTFAINKSGFPAFLTGEGGFGRPIDVAFGPDDALYILDMGSNLRSEPDAYVPNTGVIWKIVRE